MNKNDLLFAALGKLVTASPDHLDPAQKALAPINILKSQAFRLDWRIASRCGIPDTWINVFRICVSTDRNSSLAPNGVRVWWWHAKSHPLPGLMEWNPLTSHPDYLEFDSDYYLKQFRIIASVMEKLPELKRLLKA